ncbi:multiprotein bridging factor aMBF1 [Halorubrum ezzemoulense]|uniref:Multiprotein bridging factor aMBF1 n=2 Tax=Halorubrum ezzemoulense TaxID=337243 RepID=A0A256JNT7_HALEZ|nr:MULTISPECIES: multiprotein bridging factor aMBF1 [Halorubrum]MDB2223677.1 multiprotein bridging factor aMBF1 [Halorubrum ezzemoulense]MDB2236538.1 multiprotein bridging factor aMBF1 [Halorubrum ezzemoulense]MDB2241105.1 multiprotein bridging factor aMBF1 [Halorubrum ezzemoulense]MDB2244804.1 multiprotein bridging factor aMBF1 [Halorubrum ezzemoulense]MDB2248174.1 multiprotein bridging factor aMBF1 [Halorubrum ezzemoulense]
MPQCEMCGAEEASLTTTKVEGAELELCSSCTDFGTEVRDESTSSGGGKYSTSSSTGKSSSSSGSSGSGGSSGSSTRPRDMFDDMDEIATDYDELIRDARESRGLSQEELADQLNEKASLIRKLERADTLPTDEVQRKLERALDISLVEGQSTDDADWETDDAGTMTLGDVVKRKD